MLAADQNQKHKSQAVSRPQASQLAASPLEVEQELPRSLKHTHHFLKALGEERSCERDRTGPELQPLVTFLFTCSSTEEKRAETRGSF